jgi:hypothetical protein
MRCSRRAIRRTASTVVSSVHSTGSGWSGRNTATFVEFLWASIPTQVIEFGLTTGLLRMRLWRRWR